MIFTDTLLPESKLAALGLSSPDRPALFERLEHWQDLKHQVGLARLAGAVAEVDRKAGRAEAKFGEDLLFRARYKGQAEWIVEYSAAFYSR